MACPAVSSLLIAVEFGATDVLDPADHPDLTASLCTAP